MLTSRHFSEPTAESNHRPRWACDICGKPIEPGHGFIGVKWADIRRRHTPGEDHIRWHALHGEHVNELSETWWFTSVYNVTSFEQLGAFVVRLEHQPWFEFSEWDEFLGRALKLAGAR